MTTERAIEILNPKHREYYDGIDVVNEACEMAIVALEKQIPKKPEYEGDGYSDNGQLLYDTAYCPNRGQALDWRDEE